MTKKILVVGNGGRENAICLALSKSPQKPDIYNFASAINPGIKSLVKEIILGDIMDLENLKKIATKIAPDFAIIGPDDPISIGSVDILKSINIPAFAPTKKCAQLESSKAFTRNLCAKHNIEGAPDFYVSTEINDPKRKHFFEKFEGQIVVKADGLLGGKGVIVATEHFTKFEEADDFAQKSIKKFKRVVLEEKLVGEEFSLISLVDGETVLDTPAIQDHKRAFEGDTGPNTGGMGCISDENQSLPFLKPSDLEAAHNITKQVMKAVKSETQETFVGVMYGGFMKTKNGIKLIEYNTRFGDPEALNILPILKNDFVEVCEKALNQDLKSIQKLEFEPVATVVKYLCPNGYPDNPTKNVSISDNRNMEIKNPNQQVFFASVAEENNQFVLKGSRAIGILGTGKNLEEALINCEAAINNFTGPLFYRKDIGTKPLIQKRIDHLNHILNK